MDARSPAKPKPRTVVPGAAPTRSPNDDPAAPGVLSADSPSAVPADVSEEDVVEDVFIKLEPDNRRRNAPTLRMGGRELDALVGMASAGVSRPTSSVAALDAAGPGRAPAQPSPPGVVAFELEAVDPTPRRSTRRAEPLARPLSDASVAPARRAPVATAIIVACVVVAVSAIAIWLLSDPPSGDGESSQGMGEPGGQAATPEP